jgi:putative FmdB family regulatory protein
MGLYRVQVIFPVVKLGDAEQGELLARASLTPERSSWFPQPWEAVEGMTSSDSGDTNYGVVFGWGCSVPHYEFLCQKCTKPFELTMTISERQKAKVKCPKCKSTKVVPQLGSFMAQASKKS